VAGQRHLLKQQSEWRNAHEGITTFIDPAPPASGGHPEKVAEEWPKVGFRAQKKELFQLPKLFISKEKCSKEDSNLHRFPY
jgi:hypothetical protein